MSAYEILGRYKGGHTEVIDEADTREQAEQMLAEYRVAFGQDWSLWIAPEENGHAH